MVEKQPRSRAFQNRQNLMGPGWERKRSAQLRREPQCQWHEDGIRCISPANVADHIKPRFEGGSDDPSNLQSLCQRHSDTKTAYEGHRAWDAHKIKVRERFLRPEVHPGLR